MKELLASAKPILFNTEMVQAILDGRKSCTRRVIKQRTDGILTSQCRKEHPELTDADFVNKLCRAKYEFGDILYVRETWSTHYSAESNGELVYCYRADGVNLAAECLPGENNRWYPSIHMPKEAARIYLKVTGVRAERLQEITGEQCVDEGIPLTSLKEIGAEFTIGQFSDLWNSTIKKSDIDRYGWNANPWVWVYEFERIDN